MDKIAMSLNKERKLMAQMSPSERKQYEELIAAPKDRPLEGLYVHPFSGIQRYKRSSEARGFMKDFKRSLHEKKAEDTSMDSFWSGFEKRSSQEDLVKSAGVRSYIGGKLNSVGKAIKMKYLKFDLARKERIAAKLKAKLEASTPKRTLLGDIRAGLSEHPYLTVGGAAGAGVGSGALYSHVKKRKEEKTYMKHKARDTGEKYQGKDYDPYEGASKAE